jgi:hypothetical protein
MYITEYLLHTIRTDIFSNIPRILIFSHASERDGQALVKEIARSLQKNGVQMRYVIFCKMEESRGIAYQFIVLTVR